MNLKEKIRFDYLRNAKSYESQQKAETFFLQQTY